MVVVKAEGLIVDEVVVKPPVIRDAEGVKVWGQKLT